MIYLTTSIISLIIGIIIGFLIVIRNSQIQIGGEDSCQVQVKNSFNSFTTRNFWLANSPSTQKLQAKFCKGWVWLVPSFIGLKNIKPKFRFLHFHLGLLLMKKLNKLQQVPLSTYVAFSIAVLLIYTIVALVLSCFGIQNDTLTQSVFSCFGGECLFCCLIKLLKIHKEVKTNRGESSWELLSLWYLLPLLMPLPFCLPLTLLLRSGAKNRRTKIIGSIPLQDCYTLSFRRAVLTWLGIVLSTLWR